MSKVLHHPHGGRNYNAFHMQIYAEGIMQQKLPRVTTDSTQLEAQAEKYLGEEAFHYVAGGAGAQETVAANREAFKAWRIIPRMLRTAEFRDLRTKIMGVEYECPIFVAPVGVQRIFHHHAEIGVAEVAAGLGVPYILSTASSCSIEDVAKASGEGSPRWFQLYWPVDEEVTESLLKRAKASGFTALVVTLDTWTMGWRPKDLNNAYLPFVEGIGNQVGFSDPVFRKKFKEGNDGREVEEDVFKASAEWSKTAFPGKSHKWEDIAILKRFWHGPIVLKGIQHVDDAKMAVEAGVQGIVVSNHGGRQVDGAIGSLEVLPEIVEAVGDKLDVLFDSGIRSGVDIIKALCLGAKGVFVGRPFVYGLAIGGKQGARAVLAGLLADMDQSMGLAGLGSIADCKKSVLRKA